MSLDRFYLWKIKYIGGIKVKSRIKRIFSLLLVMGLLSGCFESSNQTPPTNPSVNNSTQGQRQSAEDQIADSAGFSFKELEMALRKVGAITESGERYDVSDTYFKSATRYGNIVIALTKDESIVQAYTDFEKGTMQLKGENVKVANMIGGYVLIVLEGDISQEAIKAFQAVGGL